MVELLSSLLQFNPKKRLTVEECLKLPVFDTIRVPALEKQMTENLIILDVDAENAFDFETFTDNLHPHKHNYMKMILKEIKLLREHQQNTMDQRT